MVNTNVNTIGINGKVFFFFSLSSYRRYFMENSSNLVRCLTRREKERKEKIRKLGGSARCRSLPRGSLMQVKWKKRKR